MKPAIEDDVVVQWARRRHHDLQTRNARIFADGMRGGPSPTEHQLIEAEAAEAAYEMARQNLRRYYDAHDLSPPV